MKTETSVVLRYMVHVLLILLGLYALYLFSHVAQGDPVPNGAIFTAVTNAFVGISIGGAAYLLGRKKNPGYDPAYEKIVAKTEVELWEGKSE